MGRHQQKGWIPIQLNPSGGLQPDDEIEMRIELDVIIPSNQEHTPIVREWMIPYFTPIIIPYQSNILLHLIYLDLGTVSQWNNGFLLIDGPKIYPIHVPAYSHWRRQIKFIFKMNK